MKRTIHALLAAALLVTASGCRDDETKLYGFDSNFDRLDSITPRIDLWRFHQYRGKKDIGEAVEITVFFKDKPLSVIIDPTERKNLIRAARQLAGTTSNPTPKQNFLMQYTSKNGFILEVRTSAFGPIYYTIRIGAGSEIVERSVFLTLADQLEKE